MITEQIIAGAILFIVGGLNVVRPDVMLRFQVWTQRVIMGANYEPGPRTYKIVKGLGVFFVLLGLLVLTGVIQ